DEAINYVDVVSRDIKLPSVNGQSAYFKEHHEFMEIVYVSGTELFVKLVVNANVKVKEIDEASKLIAGISSDIPLILQPLNPNKSHKDQLLSFQAVAKRNLNQVRVIPQIHKFLRML
ncbi:MAG: radical SAM protein, partial [Candidatus Saganbacteria bacterium]|nr:radical SAM protein [Candidatus Saganbacteria bacterium]